VAFRSAPGRNQYRAHPGTRREEQERRGEWAASLTRNSRLPALRVGALRSEVKNPASIPAKKRAPRGGREFLLVFVGAADMKSFS
jgi:hypothetical protein